MDVVDSRLCILFSCSRQIWDSATGKLVHTYDEHSEQVNCCHFTNKSNHLLLATGSNDFFLKVSVGIGDYEDEFVI